VIPAQLLDEDTKYHINPTGRVVIGGPMGDTGLTGRKIIVDTYGGMGRHGGGAFSGKDPTTVDRSAAYMARHIAKNIVAAQLADRCEVQLAYAIGVAEPVSVRVDAVVISTQHAETVSNEELLAGILKHVIQAVLPAHLLDEDTKYHINPTGRFVIGGPMGDTGLTGRKIIVDTYGGMGRHGGGAFSGKDPTKVDRSAAYMARHIAKNIVAAKLADRCEVQLAYAIGVAEPVSVRVDTFGTEKVDPAILPDLIRAHFKLTPRGIIESLDLRRPIYKKTAAYGHFGRNDPDFTWETTDKAAKLASDAGVREPAAARN